MPLLYTVTSLMAFILYAADKSAAKKHRRRIRETTLLALGQLGGWPGALLAQQLFRHKTKKRSFQWKFWITVGLNLGAAAYWTFH